MPASSKTIVRGWGAVLGLEDVRKACDARRRASFRGRLLSVVSVALVVSGLVVVSVPVMLQSWSAGEQSATSDRLEETVADWPYQRAENELKEARAYNRNLASHGQYVLGEANDPFTMRDGKIATATNKNGGINGGITNGMPIVFRTVLKPTPSIYKQQHTVDYIGRTDAELQIKGRHDPCIVPRAAVVQNSLTAFGLLDLLTVRYGTLAQKHGFPKV